MKLNEYEKKFIKQNKALPKSVIVGMVSELKDILVDTDDVELIRVRSKFIKELTHWLEIIEIFSTPQKKGKKETFV